MSPIEWITGSIRNRLIAALSLYLLLLTLLVTVFVVVSNERAEQFVWHTLLSGEMSEVEGSAHEPDDEGKGGAVLRYAAGDSLPPEFASLDPGLHDDVSFNGRLYAVLTEIDDSARRVVAVDVTELEQREHKLIRDVAFTVLALMVLFGLLGAWGLTRGLAPLGDLVRQVRQMTPGREAQSVSLRDNATRELQTIAEAVNGFADRNQQFLDRERTFINSASHELRTPVAVLRTQLELAASEPDREFAAAQIGRAASMTANIESLINVLLVLARDPERLTPLLEPVELRALVEEQVALHQFLIQEKELKFDLSAAESVTVEAPLRIAQVAVANLVRNAIENSDRGVIHVAIDATGTLTVKDPGHGMSPQEISALYARVARGDHAPASGIGMQLLARICEHLGWQLRYQDSAQGETVASLRFSRDP